MPESTPSSNDTGMTTAKTQAARIAVLPSRGQSTSETSVRKRIDSPKSPTTKLLSQVK